MKLSRVLIVYKKSTYQIQGVEHKEPRFLELIEQGHASVTRVVRAHDEHYNTLEKIKAELTSRKIDYYMAARADLNKKIVSDVDLIISVGGDGTFLDASHHTLTVPILGVNSATSSSFGHFCIANEKNFTQTLDDIEAGKLTAKPILRLELVLNGQPISQQVLNEALICHSNPAGTSRYFIELAKNKEEQRSSGILVGPPAGSTGFLKAAGGVVLPITDRSFQYVVREPCPRPNENWHLTKGIVTNLTEEIKIVSETRTAAIFIDGAHIVYRFPLGEELIIRASKNDLMAFINPNLNQIFQG